MKVLTTAVVVCALVSATAWADYIDLPVKWSQTPYDAETEAVPKSNCVFEYGYVHADDFVCNDGAPIVAVRWWGTYPRNPEPRPTGTVTAHIAFHLSTGDHPDSLPMEGDPIVLYTVEAQQEQVGNLMKWTTQPPIYRYDAYLPVPFDQYRYSHPTAPVAGQNVGELFIAICVPDPDALWCWMPLPVSGEPILDWAAASIGHAGPWHTSEGLHNVAFELMVPEPATMGLLAAGLAGLVVRRKRRS